VKEIIKKALTEFGSVTGPTKTHAGTRWQIHRLAPDPIDVYEPDIYSPKWMAYYPEVEGYVIREADFLQLISKMRAKLGAM
jgi:hypothetical protein